MRDACLCQVLIDCQLCCHDHVIGRSKYCIHTICDQCACCSDNFIIGACCLLCVGNALLIQVCLRVCNRLGGVCFGQGVQKAYILNIRVLGQHHFHDFVGIQSVAGSGHIVDAGQLCCLRIGNCCEDNRCLGVLGAYGHNLCCQSRNRDNSVYAVRNGLVANLLQGRLVVLSGINLVIDGHIIIFCNLIQLCCHCICNLIQRSMVKLLYDGYVVLCSIAGCCIRLRLCCGAVCRGICGSIGLGSASCHGNCQCCRTTKSYQFFQIHLLHNFFSILF